MNQKMLLPDCITFFLQDLMVRPKKRIEKPKEDF